MAAEKLAPRGLTKEGVQSALLRLVCERGVPLDEFFGSYWEQRPLVLHAKDKARAATEYARSVFSTETLKQLLRGSGPFRANVNVCRYEDGHRVNYTPEAGKGGKPPSSSALWDLHDNGGCTLQVFQPQQHWRPLATLCAQLEEDLRCLVGANAYLTPPNSQGLAPHHDDVDVFVLQLEGTKTWCLHEPVMTLPRDHSDDMDPRTLGRLLMEVALEPGSLLYMPRGTIHYARTQDGQPSHHVTISTYQRNAWFDLLGAAIPRALESAFNKDERYRRGLPVGSLGYMGTGVACSSTPASVTSSREEFVRVGKELVGDLASHIDFDSAVDEHAMDFFASRLPPAPRRVPTLLPSASSTTTTATSSKKRKTNSEDKAESSVKVRWRFPNHVRLVVKADVDVVVLFFSAGNQVEGHMGTPDPDSADPAASSLPPFFKFPKSYAPALSTLCISYPAALGVSDLPGLAQRDFEGIIAELAGAGLLEVFP